MKKLVIQYTNDGGFSTFEEFYADKVDSLSEEELATLISTIENAVSSGDIWFKHHYQEDGVAYLNYIFDSAEAVNNFSSALSIFESISGYVSTESAEMTFEEFANYASTREEASIPNERIKSLKAG